LKEAQDSLRAAQHRAAKAAATQQQEVAALETRLRAAGGLWGRLVVGVGWLVVGLVGWLVGRVGWLWGLVGWLVVGVGLALSGLLGPVVVVELVVGWVGVGDGRRGQASLVKATHLLMTNHPPTRPTKPQTPPSQTPSAAPAPAVRGRRARLSSWRDWRRSGGGCSGSWGLLARRWVGGWGFCWMWFGFGQRVADC